MSGKHGRFDSKEAFGRWLDMQERSAHRSDDRNDEILDSIRDGVLSEIQDLRQMIAENEPLGSGAILAAVAMLSELRGQADVLIPCLKDLQSGIAQSEIFAATRNKLNARKKREAKARDTKLQEEAKNVWAKHPNLTATACAGPVKRNTKSDLDVERIRKIIGPVSPARRSRKPRRPPVQKTIRNVRPAK